MTPKEAYKLALKEGPSDHTREIVSKHVIYSYSYALKIDKGPHKTTRKGALRSVKYSYLYALKHR